MEKFNRTLQQEILKICIASYPDMPRHRSFDTTEAARLTQSDDGLKVLKANIHYMKDHGLVTMDLATARNPAYMLISLRATEKAIDFMLDDGGLSAILNVQTVRLHRETIVAFEDIITIANIPEDEKKSLISKLRELPADAIKHLTLQLLSQGVLNIPAAIQLIQKLLLRG
ncbi:hypothetical protein R0L47_09905 [Pectobacterium polonicum]|uniref:hypothetical protein n=1 Tax=Pectobacterium polonicum TaxID=2485124 RepID=UPI0010F69543|nr:hypothetical protein [Pectobacterium polonicum]TKY81105.1 hypothetical protein EDI29_17560 [Pectobacterium polonicum]